MMRSDPHPNSTAEKSRFSMMAVTAIHQRLANAVARDRFMVAVEREHRLGEKRNQRRAMWSCESPPPQRKEQPGLTLRMNNH